MIIRRCLIAICMISSAAFSQDIINGSYSYTFGDSESLVEARQTCKDLAIREAIESYYIFVESSTEVETFQMKEDIIQSIAAGFLKNVNITAQNEEGRTISMTVEASVMADDVKQLVQKLMEKRESKDSGEKPVSDKEPENDDLPPVSSAERSDNRSSIAAGEASSFSLIYTDYQKKWKSAQSYWKEKDYRSASRKVQEMKAYLRNRNPGNTRRFAYSFYRTLWNHTLLVTDLLQLDYLEDQKKTIRARACASSVFSQVDKLNVSLKNLQNLVNLSNKQKAMRSRCVTQCNSILIVARSKTRAYRK